MSEVGVALPAVAFACVLVFFHATEVALTAIFHPSILDWSSLLLTPPYCIAMLCAWIEYAIEAHFFPQFKTEPRVFYTGLALVVFGEFWRKGAMLQAGVAFTHAIQTRKRSNHNLVSTGFYRYIRHPGYFGWFVWANATQIMLANPISLVLFLVATWRFFQWRIPYEESQLIK
eukprot:c9832_g1_i3.p1 GENE.c9832_g1_i3~~c9832_g1_i3.p1  ORF type:complete len:189 (+),score=36.19 c9832_g1_i3:50-568(+)